MMTRGYSCGEDNSRADGSIAPCDDTVLIWHTSGQQGLILGASVWQDQLLEGGGRKELMAAAIEGDDGAGGALEAGDVLVQDEGAGRELLLVRRREGQGLNLIRMEWHGGYGALNVETCGEWTGSEQTGSCGGSSSVKSSKMCTVVLAFVVDIAPPLSSSPSSSTVSATRFACGYNDGTSSRPAHVTLPSSHVTLPSSHVTLPSSHVTLLTSCRHHYFAPT